MTDRPTSAFHSAASAAVEDVLRHEPEMATHLGDHRRDDRLDVRSEGGLRHAVQDYRRHREALQAIDEDTLDPDDRVDREILLGALDERIFTTEELVEIEWDPLVYNPGNAIYPLIARETLPVSDRLRAIAARLDQVPELVDLSRKQLSRAPRVHLETALQQNAGTVALVRDEVARLLKSDASMNASVEPAQSRALDALGRHGAYLQQMLDRPGAARSADSETDDGFRLGPEKFARKLELTLNSELSVGEVLRRAHEHLETLTELMDDACRKYLVGVVGRGGASGLSGADAVRTALDEVAQRRGIGRNDRLGSESIAR